MSYNINWVKNLQKLDWSELFATTEEYHRWLKKQYVEYGTCAKSLHDKLAHSMQDGMTWQRFRAEDEGWVTYGFVEFDPEDIAISTDVEIDEWFAEEMAIDNRSEHDCSGKAFTRYIHWHRNPCGISFVHKVGIDV